MDDSVDYEERHNFETTAALAAFIDSLSPIGDRALRRRLGQAKQLAEGSKNDALVNAIDAEGHAYIFFSDANSLSAAIIDIKSLFTNSMIEYLRIRRNTTPQLRLRARYSHVIAAYTNRQDEGLLAVDAYVAAVEHHLTVEDVEPANSLHALHKLVPLMVSTGRRYRVWDRTKQTLLASVRTTNPYLRKAILEIIVNDQKMTSSELMPLRDDLLQTIRGLRGSSDLAEIQAMADLGSRLDARSGTSDREHWLHALTEVYAEVIARGEHPLLREEAAQRAALIFQQLGDGAGQASMIRLQREYAGKGLDYHYFSEPIDPSGDLAKFIRGHLDDAFETGGSLRVLGYLGWSSAIMPKLTDARKALDDMAEQGVKIFGQITSTVARAADLRVTAHDEPGEGNEVRSLWDQFGFAWVQSSYIMAVAAQAMISNGVITFEHVIAFVSQTWLGAREPDQPNDLIALLAAPLRVYIDLVTNRQHDDAMVVMIDSLTLRFEAIFRKLARRLSEPDLVQRLDNNGRPYTQVIGLGILDNDRIRTCLGEDLHAFATYTLAHRDEGLRDRIAHAATHAEDYTMQNAHALVFLILRLAVHQGYDSGESAITEDGDSSIEQAKDE